MSTLLGRVSGLPYDRFGFGVRYDSYRGQTMRTDFYLATGRRFVGL